MKINKDNLEKAIGNNDAVKISKEQEIGHHRGALSTLINERNELVRIVQNVEAIMQAHIKRLGELGVKIQQKK